MSDAGTAKHIDAARKVAHEAAAENIASRGFSSPAMDAALTALDRAGLLRTGIEQRAVWACERYYEWADHKDALAGFSKTASAIGRESLAAKQPKPRWTVVVEESHPLAYCVSDSKDRLYPARFQSEADARAYAASKNAEAK